MSPETWIPEIEEFLGVHTSRWASVASTGPDSYESHAFVELSAVRTMAEDREEMRHLANALGAYASTPNQLNICIWDGWGIDFEAPVVEGSWRRYYLFESDLVDFGPNPLTWPQASEFAPAFVWPADRSWVLAKDVDQDLVGVAASAEAVESLHDQDSFRVVGVESPLV